MYSPFSAEGGGARVGALRNRSAGQPHVSVDPVRVPGPVLLTGDGLCGGPEAGNVHRHGRVASPLDVSIKRLVHGVDDRGESPPQLGKQGGRPSTRSATGGMERRFLRAHRPQLQKRREYPTVLTALWTREPQATSVRKQLHRRVGERANMQVGWGARCESSSDWVT